MNLKKEGSYIMIFDKSVKPMRYNEKVSCIYRIKHLSTGKVYIGQTVDFRKRINAHINAVTAINTNTYPIARAIAEYGHEAFEVSILEYCDPDKLTERERYYIDLFHSEDPSIGYNVNGNVTNGNTAESRLKKSISHTGLKQKPVTKKKRSNPIYAFNEELNMFLICDSAKLFGDFVGSSKDMMKNCLRLPSKYHGWRVYYADMGKRLEIRAKCMKKRSIRDMEYHIFADLIDRLEMEGVETICHMFDTYLLSYDFNVDTCTNFLVPIRNSYDLQLAQAGIFPDGNAFIEEDLCE